MSVPGVLHTSPRLVIIQLIQEAANEFVSYIRRYRSSSLMETLYGPLADLPEEQLRNVVFGVYIKAFRPQTLSPIMRGALRDIPDPLRQAWTQGSPAGPLEQSTPALVTWKPWGGSIQKYVNHVLMFALEVMHDGVSAESDTSWRKLRSYAIPAAVVGTAAGLAKRAIDGGHES